MVDGFITNKEKLSFREIVLSHLKKILEISCNEFTGGYSKVISYNPTREEYVPNQRKCYTQAVENFALVLIPHFDKDMEKDYKTYKEKLKGIRKEIIKYLKEKYGNTEDQAKKFCNENPTNYEEKYSEIKLEFAHLLFADLNKLLKRNDYLKTSIYTEEDDDEDIKLME